MPAGKPRSTKPLGAECYALVPTTDPNVPLIIESIAGRVWVDPSQTVGQERLGVIAHEIIHVLGRNHVDAGRFPKTLMVAGGSEESGHTPPARCAVYAHLEPGVTPAKLAEALGPWADTSLHVRRRTSRAATSRS